MNACTFRPYVDGKPSKLYMDLLDLTGKNREVANLMYALSLQPAIKEKFTHSDLNGQGEPEASVFIEKMGFDELLKVSDKIFVEAKALGAVTKANKPIYFETSNELVDKVKEFNDNHKNMKAVIKYSQEGYYMSVEPLSATNYSYNNSLKAREAIYTDFLARLRDFGLNDEFTPDTVKRFGITNIRFQLKVLSNLNKNGIQKISGDTANLLLDMFESEPLVARLYDIFGDDTAKAFSQFSGWFYGEEKLDIDDHAKELFKNLKSIMTKKLAKVMNSTQMEELIAEAETSFSAEEPFEGTTGLDVHQTLRELYRNYHLDQEATNLLMKDVTKVSEAADKLFQIRLRNYQEAELKGVKNKKEQNLLKKNQRYLENARYLDSIAKLLETLKEEILSEEALERLLKKRSDKLAENPNSLEAIQDYSAFVLKQLTLVENYTPILEELSNINLLDNDDEHSATDLAASIKETAREALTALNAVKTHARQKQTEVVHAFLKIYWGEDTAEARKARGSDTTLDEIMQAASKDINIFDRFIYAAGTCSDEMMTLIAEAVKTAKEKRDAKLRTELAEIRSATEALFKAGKETKCVFEMDEKGNPSKMKSNYNYAKYEKDLEAYKESIKGEENYNDLLNAWVKKHTKYVKEFGIELAVPYLKENGKNIYAAERTVQERLSPEEYKYYELMMTKKANMLSKIAAASNDSLYDVIEISNDAVGAFTDAGGDPGKAFEIIKNKVMDVFVRREDDTDYGADSLAEMGIIKTHLNAKGEEIRTLPLFYTHKIKDRSRVSTDFSKAMMAYLASSTNYVEMDKIIDALMLAKNYMLNRRVNQTQGEGVLADVSSFGKKTYVNLASKMGIATGLGGLAEDFYERNVFGRSKADEGYLWGTKLRKDKLADMLTGYTSITGLTTNFLGAQANLYVGKLQMLIDAGCGEFFNMKDMMYADVEYFHMLPDLMKEFASTKKSSLLGLMMERFDVTDDFYEKIKETGFYNNPISKIIGNRSLFFMYGMGEHLLHAEGMIAVLHNKKNKVVDEKGQEHNLIDAFYVEKDSNGQGTLKVKEGWRRKDGGLIDDEYIDKIKGRIAYTNKSMHGAFGSLDKGMIHRYAAGRLIMNFRQWMPAHYSRRFRGRHYDTDLHEYREGYYVSTFNFLKDVAKDLTKAKFQLATRWGSLSSMEKYNIKRAISETSILVAISALLFLIGPAKDHKGNWAARHLIYQLSRMQMETMASTPLSGFGFVSNGIKMLQSPMACINTMEKIANLLKFTDMAETIESGKHEGENKYVRTLEKSLPFYNQIQHALELASEDDMFLLFN